MVTVLLLCVGRFDGYDKSKYREKTKKLLKQIIKNASTCNNLTDTRKKCRIRKDKFINLLKKFSKMGICVITTD